MTKIFRKREWEKEADSINPSHYKDTDIEFIDYCKSSMGSERFKGFLEGNMKKYMHRWKNKNGVEDLKKLKWYLNRLIEEEND
tara:strand:+ start:1247 stop:1495 length:249 start_codon:yes stop_codon:yes gene_type:complete